MIELDSEVSEIIDYVVRGRRHLVCLRREEFLEFLQRLNEGVEPLFKAENIYRKKREGCII